MIKSAVFPCYSTTTLLIDHCGMELLHLIEKAATNEGSSKVPEEFCFIFSRVVEEIVHIKATPIMIIEANHTQYDEKISQGGLLCQTCSWLHQ